MNKIKSLLLTLTLFLFVNNANADSTFSTDWQQTITSFESSEAFKTKLQEFISKHSNTSIRSRSALLEKASSLLNHLIQNSLSYGSLQDFTSVLTALAEDDNRSIELQIHLKWFLEVLELLLEIEPYNSSYKKVVNEINLLLSLSQSGLTPESLEAYIDELLIGRFVEKEKIEALIGVSRSSNEYSIGLFRAFRTGSLIPFLRRLQLRKYLNLDALFAPVVKSLQTPTTTRSNNGRQHRNEQVRDYENPESFSRNGKPVRDDYKNILIGDMSRRQAYRQNTNPRGRTIRPSRKVILLSDISFSMYASEYAGEEKWRLRNDLIVSYLDSLFSKAQANDEDLTVWLFNYDNGIHTPLILRSIDDLRSLYVQIANEKESGVTTNHTRAYVQAIDHVLENSDETPTHLTLIPITDGDMSVDVSAIKEKLSGLTDTRISFSSITIAEGNSTFVTLTQDLARGSDSFLSQDVTHHHIDKDEIKFWNRDQNIFDGVLNRLNAILPNWSINAFDLLNVNEAVTRIQVGYIDRNLIPQLNTLQSTGDGTALTGQNGDSEQKSNSATNRTDDDPLEKRKTDQGNRNEDKNSAELQLSSEGESTINSQESIEKSDEIEIARIIRYTQTLPKILYITNIENLPLELHDNRSEQFNSDLVHALFFNSLSNNEDLLLETASPSRVLNDRLTILKPEGYALANIAVFDEQGQSVRGYTVYEIPKNGLYYLEFDIGVNLNDKKLSYRASYQLDRRSRNRPNEFNSLNKNALSRVIQELQDAGANELTTALNSLISSSNIVSVEDVAHIFDSTGYYTFNAPSETNISDNTSNAFNAFCNFLNNGTYYYQCSGANSLMATFFRRYFIELSADTLEANSVGKLESETLTGFIVKSHVTVTAKYAHRMVSLSKRDLFNSYVRLDSTPFRLDSSALSSFSPHRVESEIRRGSRDNFVMKLFSRWENKILKTWSRFNFDTASDSSDRLSDNQNAQTCRQILN